MTELAPFITAEEDAAFDAFDSHEGIGLIRPRVATALLEGLAQDAFLPGYLPDERDDFPVNPESERLWKSLRNLAEVRYASLDQGDSDYRSYKYGLRVSRVLMDLQAKATVGEITVTSDDIDAYTQEIKRLYRGLQNRFRADGQGWYRESFSGDNGWFGYNKQLERVAREVEKYRPGKERWQIRMGLYDGYQIVQTKMNEVFASDSK